jgi:hypothetical protein
MGLNKIKFELRLKRSAISLILYFSCDLSISCTRTKSSDVAQYQDLVTVICHGNDMPRTIADHSQALHPPTPMTIGHTKNRRRGSFSVIAVESNAVFASVVSDHIINCPIGKCGHSMTANFA